MKIDDILKLIEADKKIDYSQLDTESLKIPEQAIKYHQLAHEESVHLRFLEKEYNVLGELGDKTKIEVFKESLKKILIWKILIKSNLTF